MLRTIGGRIGDAAYIVDDQVAEVLVHQGDAVVIADVAEPEPQPEPEPEPQEPPSE